MISLEVGILKNTYYEKSVFIITFFSTFMLVQFGIFDLFWILQTLFIIIHITTTKKLQITKNKMVISLYVVWILSTLLCFVSDIPLSYKKNSLIAIAFLTPTFFTISTYEKHISSNKFVAYTKKALALTCVTEVILCMVQFLLYNVAHIDLNQLVFRDILHMVENPSQYKLGVYHPSGLCWHSAFMTPIVIITFVICDNYLIKALAVADAIVCNNATAMIGICICVALSVFFSAIEFLKKADKTIKRRTLIAALSIFFVIILVIFSTNAVQVVCDKIANIYGRATGAINDGGSADAHIRYYTAYPNVVKNGNIVQFLFGYGTANSGYTMSKMYGQYTELKSWVVETDVMNQLYSNGIIGFVLYYGFLSYIAIKGYKLDRRYFIMMASIILAGVTYNIQFDWVVYLEFLLYFTVKKGINLFNVDREG